MDIMEMFRWLDDEQKQRFVQLQHMFETEGWRNYLKPFLAEKIAYYRERGAAARSWEENRESLGARQFAEEMHNLDDAVLTEFVRIAEERKAAHHAEVEEEYE